MLLMIPETVNRIFGRTNNRQDETRTAGGSSGGEGALVGTNCSPLGIGTDVGGSIRIPAFFNDVYGYTPGFKRTSDKGMVCQNYDMVDDGHQDIKAVFGPLGRSVEDLAIMT